MTPMVGWHGGPEHTFWTPLYEVLESVAGKFFSNCLTFYSSCGHSRNGGYLVRRCASRRSSFRASDACPRNRLWIHGPLV